MARKDPIAAKTMIYVATRACGCIAGVLVARPGEEKPTAKVLAAWMQCGWTLASTEDDITVKIAPYCTGETPLFAPKDADDLDRTPIRITTADGRSAETDLETMSRAVDMIRSGRIRLGQDADDDQPQIPYSHVLAAETDDAGPPMALAGVTYAPLDEIHPHRDADNKITRIADDNAIADITDADGWITEASLALPNYQPAREPDPGLIEALEALGINNDDNARTAQAYMERKTKDSAK